MPPISDRDDSPARFDWDGAYRRLASIEEALEHTIAASAAEADAILRRRAEMLAAPAADADGRETIDLLGFVSGGMHYGLHVDQVETVVESPIMPVPGLPSLHLGVFNKRGVIVSAIDLSRVLGTGAGSLEDTKAVVVIAVGNQRLGIAVEEILGIAEVATADIVPVGSQGGSGEFHGAISGLAPGRWLVLDASYLTGDARIVVDEEVPIIGSRGDSGE